MPKDELFTKMISQMREKIDNNFLLQHYTISHYGDTVTVRAIMEKLHTIPKPVITKKIKRPSKGEKK